MSEFFSFIQKAVLVAILAWLGIQFTPSDSDQESSPPPAESVLSNLIR